MSGTEEVPNTRPTEIPSAKRTWWTRFAIFIPLLIWIAIGFGVTQAMGISYE